MEKNLVFKIEEKFEVLEKDKPLVRLAKRTINGELDKTDDLVFEVFTEKDKEKLERRFSIIENNDLTFETFKKTMELLGVEEIKVVTFLDKDKVGFEETM